ncbi:multidrug effflux MFS transporter [Mycobacterium hubeiense]|uniref:multidrug effflux MFS transporter n=1 Tax=Mycobacterium hubeiense TaxID=1867256 RepID=UPI001E4E6267|nr:multidrug effflux MFS transporter [Mycobacterium sp. QGD 101]
MYLPGLPAKADEFGTSTSAIQLTLTTFMVGLAVGQLVIGPLSDRFGRRPLVLAGTLVCIAASAACALAPSIELLAASRFVLGFSGAAGVVLSRAVITDRARGGAAAKIFSLMMIINGAAPVVAPLLGGALLAPIGWRGVFWVITGLAVAMFIGALVWLSESHPHEHRTTGGLVALARNVRTLLANRRYLGYTLAFAFSFAVMFAYIAASPFVLQKTLGLSTTLYSIAFASNAIGLIVINAVNAKIVERFGQRCLLHTGVALLVMFSTLLVIDAVLGPVLWATLVLLACTVASLGLIVANATSLALEEARHAAGTGSALMGALQFGLAALAAPMVGAGGEFTAIPMALVMVVSATVAAGSLALTK